MKKVRLFIAAIVLLAISGTMNEAKAGWLFGKHQTHEIGLNEEHCGEGSFGTMKFGEKRFLGIKVGEYADKECY